MNGLAAAAYRPACVITVFAVDALHRRVSLSRVMLGITDEAAHAATGLLLAGAGKRRRGDFMVGVILGAVGIDADHVPGEMRRTYLRPNAGRPASHSLLTAAAAAAAATRLRGRLRTVALGVPFGILAHLLRDLATGGTGVPLFWPLGSRHVRLPYATYAAVLTAASAAGRPGARRGREG